MIYDVIIERMHYITESPHNYRSTKVCFRENERERWARETERKHIMCVCLHTSIFHAK